MPDRPPAPTTELAWLIERIHEGSPVWMRHDATWTSDATQARRFVLQEEAGRVIAATRSEARVVEHGFYSPTPAESIRANPKGQAVKGDER